MMLHQNGKTYFNKSARQSPWSKILRTSFKNEKRADLILIARDGEGVEERYPVMSTWIALRSEGMANVIDGLDPRIRELFLPNVTPNILRHAINFIAFGNFIRGINEDGLLGLLEFQLNYPTTQLSERCGNNLKKLLKVDNAIKIWRKAVEYEITDLLDASLAFILRNAKDICAMDGFLNLTVTEWLQLLEKDGLNCDEIDLFNAVLKWGKHTFQTQTPEDSPQRDPTPIELRAIVDPLIPFLRFPLVSIENMTQIVRPSHILTDEERLVLYEYILAPQDSKPNISVFIVNPRVFRDSLHITSECSSLDVTPSPQVLNGPNCFNIPSATPLPLHQNTQVNGLMMTPGTLAVQNHDFSGKFSTSSRTVIEQFFSNSRTFQVVPGIPTVINNENPQTPQSSYASSESSITNTRKRARKSSSHQSTDSSASLFYDKHDCSYRSWEDFVQHFQQNPEDIIHSTFKINLQNVTLDNNYRYPIVVLQNLQKITLNLTLKIKLEQKEMERFERYFDIRRYVFYRRKIENSGDLNLEELWDSKMRINIEINGVTMLRMNHAKKELAIGFRNDSLTILSGIGKGGQLQKLSLMKTDVPNIVGFPCKHLKEVIFYHVWALSEYDVKEFVKRCTSLESFSCWVICPWWENMKKGGNNPALYSPSELDLTKDLVSAELKHLALCKAVLTLCSKTVKNKLTDLYLDNCFWPDTFADNFSSIFPTLQRCALRQRAENERVRPNRFTKETYKSAVSVRLVHEIVNLSQITWVRIWGLDWNERHVAEAKGSSKLLRSSINPVTVEEIIAVKTLLQRCNIRDNAQNFILERDPLTNSWTGEELNDNEPTEYDTGFWDRMDQLDYKYYKLDNFFKTYQNLQENQVINLGLP